MTREGMEAFRAHYVPDPADYGDVRASPALCEDLDGLAPAVVVTAGFDPLRDEGTAYAAALAGAGVAVEYRCYDDMVHGFFGMGVVPDCLALATEVCDAMGSLMRRVTPHRGD
jgi:acetyl esterase